MISRTLTLRAQKRRKQRTLLATNQATTSPTSISDSEQGNSLDTESCAERTATKTRSEYQRSTKSGSCAKPCKATTPKGTDNRAAISNPALRLVSTRPSSVALTPIGLLTHHAHDRQAPFTFTCEAGFHHGRAANQPQEVTHLALDEDPQAAF